MRPLEFATIIGALSNLGSKNKLRLVEISMISLEGTSFIYIMYDNWSCSFSPGKSGYPDYNSARIQPKLHMSIAEVYGIPRIISGAL